MKLLATIMFEKDSQKLKEYGTLWHMVFDGSNGDKLFEEFLIEAYPEGCIIGEDEIKKIQNSAFRYLTSNEHCLDLKADLDKQFNTYYVYFKPYKKVFPCGFCEHSKTVFEILKEFFHGAADDLSSEYLKRFILENFEVRSDNTTVLQLANDSDFLLMKLHRVI